MIELNNIHKSFKGHQVLQGVNLQIPKGKITVIIGRSGEGKSVLLKHIMRLLDPDAGKVLVEGVDLSSLGDRDIKDFRKKFGMLFQNAALFDSLNVYDNVAFPLVEHAAWPQNKIDERVEEVLGLVGLTGINEKMPNELSGGMRKRVGLARAIALTPEILLYDEPTTGLDPLLTDSINRLIIKTQQKLGATSIIISHDIEATFRIADKVAMLHEGKILLEGNESVFRSSQIPFIRHFLEGRSTEEVVD